MGQEINSLRFNRHDYALFSQRLRDETLLLLDHFRNNKFAYGGPMGGFEIEAWLVDRQGRPAPFNRKYLQGMNPEMVVPELADFNIEINSRPRYLTGDALTGMHDDLLMTIGHCRNRAVELGLQLLMIGILPTVGEHDLTLRHMSEMARYRALNDEILKMRAGRPMHLHIDGDESLSLTHDDVMLEAATTSFQIHMQIAPALSARYYNAALIASAPVVAACANSPFLFGKGLWNETRIPLFEQAVEVGREESRRVTFGSGYVHGSILECFEENLAAYPVLIPNNVEDDPRHFSHVRFHNGMIWRWNRPLIGIDRDGLPHLRIEHRVIPAGPTVVDSIANAALFYGYTTLLASQAQAPEFRLDFASARANFYQAARNGLDAELSWFDGRGFSVRQLLLEEVIPAAGEGLAILGINSDDSDRYLGIIRARVATGQNGACWQKRFIEQRSTDMGAMSLAYLANQMTDRPVHEWEI